MSPTATNDPARLPTAFAHVLRQVGLAVPVGSVLAFRDALAAVGLERPGHVYWAGRATLVHRHEDVARYDEAFVRFWGGRPPAPPPFPRIVTVEGDAGGEDGATAGETLRYSATEVLRQKDFSSYSEEDHREAARVVTALRLAPPLQRTRRMRPGAGRSPDLRRTVRRALRTGGEPVVISRRRPADRLRRLILVCDVSGSMEPYTRALLRFAHAAANARGRVEVFSLGTRLTRLTAPLRSHDPDAALAACATAVEDWSGGTRLGEGVRAFNDGFAIRGLARGAIVVILSDGWDRGDPEILGEQMARLHRVAWRVIWVNPLKASPGYAPLARGMAAALPHVDDFVEGHSLAALEELAVVIAGARTM